MKNISEEFASLDGIRMAAVGFSGGKLMAAGTYIHQTGNDETIDGRDTVSQQRNHAGYRSSAAYQHSDPHSGSGTSKGL